MPRANKKSNRGSSTKGIAKGPTCQRSELKNLMRNDPKLHKTNPKLYHAACLEIGKLKGNFPQPEYEGQIMTGRNNG